MTKYRVVPDPAVVRVVANATFSEGNTVDTPSGVGVVVEVRTEDFEGPQGSTVEASEDNVAYVVGVRDGARVYRASELSEGEIETDVENPEEDLEESVSSNLAANQESTFRFPKSWRESETPNRLILLKAWAGLGGRFTSCVREMRDDLTGSPDRFCASMKDRVLQWEGWRQGG